uniref:Uncharacterized protein n=1 Tax=Anguilla anguilla TaxID=7936 RepID=A0A0E9TDM2_ANGAN
MQDYFVKEAKWFWFGAQS